MKLKRILIVWELIPEEVKFYIVTPKTKEEEELILAAHGNFVNISCDNEDAASRLSEYIYDQQLTPLDIENPIDIKTPLDLGIADVLVESGFYL